MDIERLVRHGFVPIAGQIDRNGKNYGFFNKSGVFLDPDGEELLARLESGDDPDAVVVLVAPPKKPTPKKPTPAKAVAKEPEPASAEADLADLGSILGD